MFALDDQLGDERGPTGEPSTADVLTYELPSIVETFAERFDELPTLIDGRDDYRYAIETGMLFRTALVIGQLTSDGTVVILDIQLEL